MIILKKKYTISFFIYPKYSQGHSCKPKFLWTDPSTRSVDPQPGWSNRPKENEKEKVETLIIAAIHK